jgi:hypothetical protein
VRSNFTAGQGAIELLESVPLTVLIGRAELLERGSALVGESRPIAPTRPCFTRPGLAIHSEEEEFVSSEDEMAVIAIQDTYRRDPSQRGLTCYVCFRTGHAWLDCPCLKHLSAK